jgi:hypothetical protein
MAQGSSGTALITAALILGGSIVGASYLLTKSIDRGTGEVAVLNVSLNTAMGAIQEMAKAAGKPAAAAPKRLDPKNVYEIEIGSAPIKGPKNAPITIVEWADFQ